MLFDLLPGPDFLISMAYFARLLRIDKNSFLACIRVLDVPMKTKMWFTNEDHLAFALIVCKNKLFANDTLGAMPMNKYL